MASKQLILVRHAHRDVIHSEDDNGLSPKGKKQALAIRDYLLKHFGNQRPLILSSPRLRCIETLEPLSNALRISIDVKSSLDEGAAQNEPLQSRISSFIHYLDEEKKNLIVACSHGDWIPLFLDQLLGMDLALKKAGLCIIELSEEPSLKEMISDWQID